MEEDKEKLRLTLKQHLQLSKVKNMDIVILFDGSDSVSGPDFVKVLEGTISLMKAFSSTTRTAVFQFANEVKLECDFTNPNELDFIKAIVKLKGSTDITKALNQAKQLIQTSGRADSSKMVYLFTNGLPSDQASCVRAANLLRNVVFGVTILGVGFGRGNREKLSEVCGINSTFILNFDSLDQLCPSENNPNEYVPGSKIEFSFKHKKHLRKLLEDLTLELEVTNNGRNPISSQDLLEVDSGGFYRFYLRPLGKEIPPYKTEKIDFTLSLAGNARIEILPEIVRVRILAYQTQKEYSCSHTGFAVVLEQFLDDLVEWEPGYQTLYGNILVFGPAGAGKSTLINFVLSLRKSVFQQKAEALGNSAHVTTTNQFYSDESNFRFMDTVGLSEENYDQTTFAQALRGAKVSRETGQKRLVVGNSIGEEDEIHSCIFVITQGWRVFKDSNPAKLSSLKEFIHQATLKKLRPILVVTRMDETEDPEEEVRKEFQELTGIAPQDIFLVRNSINPNNKTHWARGSLANDKVLYQILSKALMNVRAYLEEKDGLINGSRRDRERRRRIEEEKRQKEQESEALRESERRQEEEFQRKKDKEEIKKKLAKAEREEILRDEELKIKIEQEKAKIMREAQLQAFLEQTKKEATQKISSQNRPTSVCMYVFSFVVNLILIASVVIYFVSKDSPDSPFLLLQKYFN